MKRTSKAAARKRFDEAMRWRTWHDSRDSRFMPRDRFALYCMLQAAWLRGRAQGRKMERKGL